LLTGDFGRAVAGVSRGVGVQFCCAGRESYMAEPTIVCPNCKTEIPLTASLAAPLVASARVEYEKKLAAKDAEAAEREKGIREREDAVRRARETVDATVAQQVRDQRAQIAMEEAKKAKALLAADFEQNASELAAAQAQLKENNAKLAEAQKAQAALLVKQRELDDAKREMELNIQKRVSENLAAERDKARAEAEEITKLKLAEKDLRLSEKDQTIAAMKKQVEEAQRKAEQGSQQSQGEALELQLETMLASKFPYDRIEPVPKGEHGGDILHRVFGAGMGTGCGTILWETKRTKAWSDGWLPKLRDDQRAAKAELAVIVSAVLPKGVESFDLVDTIWVAHPRCVLPVALALRSTLVEVASARQTAAGQQTKAELVYQYLMGSGFKLRVQAIVEAFTEVQEDLQKERKVIMKQWAKRESEIGRVLEATVGLYGDLQGIAGKTMQEIEGLEMKMLEGAE